MTQKEMILKHMQEVGSITPAEAVKEYGCYRVAASLMLLQSTNRQRLFGTGG